MEKSGIDKVDRQILELLVPNARISNAEIARTIGMAPSAVLERVRKLEDRGIIRGYYTDINPEYFGLGLTAFILIRADEGVYRTELGHKLASFPEILEVHNIAGEDCYIVKVRAKDTKQLAELLRNRFRDVSVKATTKTTIVLETIKESNHIEMLE